MKNEQEAARFRKQTNCSEDAQGHCITCGDEALVGRVLQLDLACSSALVEIAGTQMEVDISLLDPVAPGDWLLVHGGVALGSASGPALPEHEVHDVHP